MSINSCESHWEIKFLDFQFCDKVKIPDCTSYNFTLVNGDPARELTVYFNIKTIIRGYHTYQSAWVPVGEEREMSLLYM